ncbi:MAG TPA: hypothetical protein VLK84_01350 [Longimicrobium sp.]|nr:hypothetical protein [Longimicrobium sp.]
MPKRYALARRGHPSWKPFLLLLLVAVAGCRTASIYSPAVQLRLAVEPVRVRAGDTLRLEFTVTNPRQDTLVLEFAEDCRVTFVVMDAMQRAIEADQRCMAPGGGRLALPAGGAWTASGTWAALADDAAPAGPYVIRGILGEHYSVRGGRREFKLSHAADTVVFHVLPPGAP